MRPVQYFTDEYLEDCKKMTHEQILQFLDNFRKLHGFKTSGKTKLISMKVEEDLLECFKQKCKQTNTPYQSQIKALMHDWIINS